MNHLSYACIMCETSVFLVKRKNIYVLFMLDVCLVDTAILAHLFL